MTTLSIKFGCVSYFVDFEGEEKPMVVDCTDGAVDDSRYGRHASRVAFKIAIDA